MSAKLSIAYLDTCVVSGLAKNDLPIEESEAVIQLLSGKLIEFVISDVALAEIEKMPREHQTPHLAIYHLLRKIRVLPEPGFTRLAPWGGPMTNPHYSTWRQIANLLPDAYDVKHVYQAVEHRADYFVTVDKTTILKHKTVLPSEIGISAVTPSDLIAIVQVGLASVSP